MQGKIHTISTVSFSPIESLPIESEIDFIKGKDKDKDKEREKDRIKTPNFSSSCTSTDSNSETGSRYSSVGVCDSWLKSEKENKEGKSRDDGRVFNGGEAYKERGRREGGQALFSHFDASLYSFPPSRLPLSL